MRILIHDFAGHAFQVQLSRELAKRGHWVTHVYPEGLPGPKGPLQRSPEDVPEFEIASVPLSKTFRKYSLLKRLHSHLRYARELCSLLADQKPQVVLSGNTPIDVQARLLWYCRRNDIAFVHWVQDVYCNAIEFFLRKNVPLLAPCAALPFRTLEQLVAQQSNAVVVIASAFERLFRSWHIPESKITTIENWAPLCDVVQCSRHNRWSAENNLDNRVVFLYSGTLGLKHRPDLLYRLAEALDERCVVVVITEGIGREYLERQPRRDNLLLLPFQPYERIPEVLATADVLLATLEAEAGNFAVPSKILSYLCAARPVLVAAPEKNLASEIVNRSGAGIAVDPGNLEQWCAAAQRLAADPGLRDTAGRKAFEYANENFDIEEIGDSFEAVLSQALEPHAARPEIDVVVSEA